VFGKSARFYDALYGFKDYEAASRRLSEILHDRLPMGRTLLDVGCGTGRHLASLAREYDVQGLDLNEELLGVARARCPGVTFHQGDMTRFDLGRRFDVVVCLFSAIAYVRTLERMRQTIACFVRHLEPGGCVVVEPWFTPEQYRAPTITANLVDQPQLKIAWMYTSRRADTLALLEIFYAAGTPAGIETFSEVHELGLFTHAEYVEAFIDAGLSVEHDPVGLFDRGLYIGAATGST
jgi:SAM-dependent methyltransferase